MRVRFTTSSISLVDDVRDEESRRVRAQVDGGYSHAKRLISSGFVGSVGRFTIVSMRRAWAGFQRRDGLKQIAIVLAALGVYEATRSFIEPNWAVAIANAERIAELERGLSFAWEQSLQRAFLGVPELVEAMNVFYFVGHFVLTGVFFLWLYRSSSEGFRSFRNGFIAATAIAVAHPLVVPDGASARRRRARDHGHACASSGTSTSARPIRRRSPIRSQPCRACMPAGRSASAWASSASPKQPALRVLGVVYPAVVILTIVVTGNHFIFDALAGIAVLAAGFMVMGIPRIRRRALAGYT